MLVENEREQLLTDSARTALQPQLPTPSRPRASPFRQPKVDPMRKIPRSPVLALVLVAAFTGTAVASPAVGFHPKTLARATLSDRVHINAGVVKFQTKGPVDITHGTITTDPLGSSGWHSHPGVVLITVLNGTVVRYHADCSTEVYAAGSAFTESGGEAGLVRNESTTTPAVSYLTYITPVGSPLRLEAANPGCASVN